MDKFKDLYRESWYIDKEGEVREDFAAFCRNFSSEVRPIALKAAFQNKSVDMLYGCIASDMIVTYFNLIRTQFMLNPNVYTGTLIEGVTKFVSIYKSQWKRIDIDTPNPLSMYKNYSKINIPLVTLNTYGRLLISE